MDAFLTILGAIAFVMLSPIYWGLALRILWGWFIVPTFDVPALSIVQAIGLQYVISFITQRYCGKDERDAMEKVATAVVTPLVFLAFGWVAHLFM